MDVTSVIPRQDVYVSVAVSPLGEVQTEVAQSSNKRQQVKYNQWVSTKGKEWLIRTFKLNMNYPFQQNTEGT